MIITTLVIVALLLGLAGCGSDPAEVKAEIEASSTVAPRVMVAPVEAHRVVEQLQAAGDLIAKEEASVSTEVGGLVTEILLDEGQAVEKGATVLEIDPERRELQLHSRQAGVARAEAGLREQERETQRVQTLGSRNVASEAQRDQAETQLQRAHSELAEARAQLGLAERALRDASVKAPFPGLIARRYVSQGEFVSPGQKLFDLVALDPIEIEFRLAEVDSARVTIGSEIDVRVAPYPDQVFRAAVSVISPRIDPATRTLRVKGVLANTDGRLRPGLFARVELGVSDRSGVAMIPEDAVLQRADGSVAFRLVDDNRVQRRILTTGLYRDGYVEVVEGLEIADLVVVRGHAALVDGAVVALRRPDGSPEHAQVMGGKPRRGATE
jgi:membrane fusion protein (multidrug efflux system)